MWIMGNVLDVWIKSSKMFFSYLSSLCLRILKQYLHTPWVFIVFLLMTFIHFFIAYLFFDIPLLLFHLPSLDIYLKYFNLFSLVVPAKFVTLRPLLYLFLILSDLVTLNIHFIICIIFVFISSFLFNA